MRAPEEIPATTGVQPSRIECCGEDAYQNHLILFFLAMLKLKLLPKNDIV